MGQRNASASACEGVLKPGVSRLAVELGGDRVEGGLSKLAEIGALGQLLAQPAVGVLVRAGLPRAVWVAEGDLDAGVDAELVGSAISRPCPR